MNMYIMNAAIKISATMINKFTSAVFGEHSGVAAAKSSAGMGISVSVGVYVIFMSSQSFLLWVNLVFVGYTNYDTALFTVCQ